MPHIYGLVVLDGRPSRYTNMINTAANGINQIGNEILGALIEVTGLSEAVLTIEKRIL